MDPIVWNVGRTNKERASPGCLQEGHFRQAVIGLAESTRLTTYSTSDGANQRARLQDRQKPEQPRVHRSPAPHQENSSGVASVRS